MRTALLVTLLGFGCGGASEHTGEPDRRVFGEDSAEDSGGDSVEYSDPCDDGDLDTGSGLLWYAGDAQVGDGEFTAGHFGWLLTCDNELADVTCESLSEWGATGPAPDGCPGCDWSFTLLASGGVAEGTGCPGAGMTGGEWDGFEGAWGFAESYTYEHEGAAYLYTTAVMYYSRAYSYWFMLAGNYGEYGYNTGDAGEMTFATPYPWYVYYY